MNAKYQHMSFDNFINHTEFKRGQPVYLNVYHLSWINYLLQIVGFGLYHTTVEVYRTEYSFGATQEDVPGIFANKIESSNKLRLKGIYYYHLPIEKIYLGNTLFTQETLYQLLGIQSSYWLGLSYDPFLKNCNHFSKFLANKLLMNAVSYPTYINRLSKYGMLFASFYPPIRTLYGDIANPYHPKKNQVFERTNSHCIENNINNSINETLRKKTEDLQVEEVILQVKKSFEINGNDNESHHMISPIPLLKTQSVFNKKTNKVTGNVKENDFFFEVLLMNKYLQYFEYNTDILKTKDDNECVVNAKIQKFLEQMIKADHSLHIQQNYGLAIELFTQCHLMLMNGNVLEKEINYPINNFKSSALIKTIVFDEKLTTMQIFELKIYHSLHFIYFTQDNLLLQEEIINKILMINSSDYFALFELALIRYSESKYPEVETLLKEASKSCLDKDYIYNIEIFGKILTNIS